jgi:alkylated DNA repair dioxygenase AlkB
MRSSRYMPTLFSHLIEPLARINLPDADLLYIEDGLSPQDADAFHSTLLVETNWREEGVMVWGKRHKQPRLVAWHGDPGATYTYSGSRMIPVPWTPTLLDIRSRVESVAERSFNSVLLNLYRDERDSMGWHSDNEPELGPNPVIASVSLGETREFQLRHKRRKELPTAKLKLTHGSILVMRGTTQMFWEHCLKRESTKHGKRINLTFRTILGN